MFVDWARLVCISVTHVYHNMNDTFFACGLPPPGADITCSCPLGHMCEPGFDEFQRFSAIFIVLEHLHICIIIRHFHKHWKVTYLNERCGLLPMFIINPARSSCYLWTMLTQSAELQCNSKCCLRVNDICAKFHQQVQIRGCHHDRTVNIHESITKIGSMDGVWVSFSSFQ